MKRGKKRQKSEWQNDKDTSESKIAKQDTDSSHSHSSSASASQQSVNTSPYFSSQNGAKHGRPFFNVPCATLAKNLLGQYMVRRIGSQIIKGLIVETEAYIGQEDKAAHSYQGKRTPRNEAMFMTPGTSYVYNIYGMYCCINISSKGDGSAVLIRALEAMEGQDLMAKGRKGKADTEKSKKPIKEKDFTNGPSKLCQALHITKNDFDQVDLTTSDALWIEEGVDVDIESIVSCARINIGYAEDWKDKPLRFYILGNSCVSVRDKKVENLLKEGLLGKDETTGT